VLFHTTNHTFQTQSQTVGDFPKDVAWYKMDFLPHIRARASCRGRAIKPSSKVASQSSARSASSSVLDINDSDAFAPSRIICAWVRHDNQHLVPELWKYSLPPDEICECLNFRQKIWALNLDLQKFVIIGGRSFLLGRQSDDDLVWNICVEIFI